jgi:hypothetical protein
VRSVRAFIAFLSVAVVGAVLLGGLACAQQDVPKITKEELQPQLGNNPDIVIIDVRSQGDWEGDNLMIKGAIREDPMNVPSWMNKYPKEKTLVFYCA